MTFQQYIWPTTTVVAVDQSLPAANIMPTGTTDIAWLTQAAYTAGKASIQPRLINKDASYYITVFPT